MKIYLEAVLCLSLLNQHYLSILQSAWQICLSITLHSQYLSVDRPELTLQKQPDRSTSQCKSIYYLSFCVVSRELVYRDQRMSIYRDWGK